MLIIIDNYDSFVFNLYQEVARPIDAVTVDDVRVVRNDKITIAEISALEPQGIILSPGPGRPEDAGICVELIRACSGKIPILGVCLGHQAIAVAFGGKVTAADKIVHGKPETIFHHGKDLYRDMPLPFVAGRYHSLVVTRENLPANFLIEAETADGTIMGMRHQHHATFGVQFHPESILTPEGGKLLRTFVGICR